MDVPELPGFYYDPERKKYFRILPNHLAPRNSSFYTHSTVADLKASEQSKAQATLATSIAAARAHRHHRANPFLRTTLFRELGTVGTPEQVCEAVRETYARSLCRRKSLAPGRGISKGLRCFDVMQGIRGAAEEERGWGEEMGQSSRRGMTAGQGGDEEGEMETLMMVVGGPNGKVVFSRYFIDKNSGELLLGDDGGVGLNMATDIITSVTFSAEGKICATTLGGSTPPRAALFHTPGYPSNPNHPTPHPVEYIVPCARSIWCSTTDLPPSTSSRSRSTTPSSSSPPSAATFALGTSFGITLINPIQYGYCNTSYPVPSDVFALAYLPTTTLSISTATSTTLLSASRDGGVRIHHLTTTQTTTPIIHHGSLLTHLHPHPTSPHLLLAKGPQKTALYDLRFPHPASPSMSFKDPTRAVLIYEDLLDPGGYQVDEGWDVSSDGGVMAGVVKAAYSTRDAEVGLWSVLTGRRLRFRSGGGDEGEGSGRRGWGKVVTNGDRSVRRGKVGVGGEGGRWVVGGVPKCIRFVDVPGVGEEVWAGVGERIERFGLGKVE